MSLRPDTQRQKVTAGKRDRKIVVSIPNASGVDAYGNPTMGAPTSLPLSASYTPVSDGEKVAAAEVMANLTARFVIAWSELNKTIDATATLTFEGRTFDILGTKALGRREAIEITAAVRND